MHQLPRGRKDIKRIASTIILILAGAALRDLRSQRWARIFAWPFVWIGWEPLLRPGTDWQLEA
jgi:hypothetical protein